MKKLIDLVNRFLEEIGLRDAKPKPQPPAPAPEPKPEPKPEPEPEPVNKDREGWGLFKPEGDLWLLQFANPTNGQRLLPSHIGKAGIYHDRAGMQIVMDSGGKPRYLRWPNGVGSASGKQLDGTRWPIDDRIDSHYHPGYASGRVKLRSAKPASGQYMIAWDVHGQEVAWMRVIDGDVRQEGRLK